MKPRHPFVALLGLALLIVPLAAPASASISQGGSEITFTANPPTEWEYFGKAVDVSGDRIVVGAPGEGAGSVYLYEDDGPDGWTETEIIPSDGEDGDNFGEDVAISGDMLVVGAYQDSGTNGDDAGSAYVYQFDEEGNVSETKLTASDGAQDDWFGRAVATDGEAVLVGAYRHDASGDGSGAAYLYRQGANGVWAETKITPSDTERDHVFGAAVAMSEGALLIGAPGDDDLGSYSGAVYLYQPDGDGGFTETKHTAEDGFAGDGFGWALDLEGDRFVVGALNDGDRYDGDDLPEFAGSAYLFEPDGAGGWAQTHLFHPTPGNRDHFGQAVALDGQTLLIGAPGDDTAGYNAGMAFVFQPDGQGTWSSEELVAGAINGYDAFGSTVALHRGYLVVGAPEKGNSGLYDTGNAYLFDTTFDSDEDGLSDSDEEAMGTDPLDPDTDDDGLQDGAEVYVHGTDPLDPDTDADGLGDGAEVNTHSTDPLDPDTDGDGLTDGAEVDQHGTDPLDADTDDDGLHDGSEVDQHRTDPLDADTDDDGLDDGPELGTYGTDPLDPDSDDDTLPDGAEVNEHGTDPLDPDTDGDGLGDAAEIQDYPTDPLDPDTDDDGLDDRREIEELPTDPVDPDTDDDELLDGEEVDEHGTDPLDPDSDDDLYQDGTEVECGTDPLDRLSFPLPTCALPDEMPEDLTRSSLPRTGP